MDSSRDCVAAPQVPQVRGMKRAECTRRVINQSCKLKLLDRLKVLKLLSRHTTIHEGADGSRVNIDTVPYDVLFEVDVLISTLLNSVPTKYRLGD